ncbi:serine hydrolase domain-containing protein [Agaribacter flavus]|uniref:Serine hydrolase domain-containing protein n=1 Tax=Agaribacter flavus TaxID=1902781 RepID=A0ABV7FLM9_9ALTE
MYKVITQTKFLLILLLSTFLLACSSGKHSRLTPPLENQSLSSYIESQDFSGSILVAKKGDILLSRGFEYATRRSDIKNTPHTEFRIGSISKQFTAVAILMLEERGLLSTEDPISKCIPQFPDSDNILIKHLLNMTSGIVNYTELPEFMGFRKDSHTPESLINIFKDESKLFAAGQQLKYSNSNYVLLGCIIELITGMTYADFIQEEIFNRLDMRDSRYGSDVIGFGKVAQGYLHDMPVATISMTVPYASGALSSSVSDLYKWHKGLSERSLISEASTQKMYSVGLADYAFGWIVSKNSEGEPFYQHGGGIDGFSSHILRSEQSGYFIAVLSNDQAFPTGQLAQNIMQIIH